MKITTKLIIALISALIILIIALLSIFFISYNRCANKSIEKGIIIEQEQEQKIDFPLPPEERYISGIIKSVQEESFIMKLENEEQEEIFLNDQTEIFMGDGKGTRVSRQEIQPNYHVACFFSKDKSNNVALIVHITRK